MGIIMKDISQLRDCAGNETHVVLRESIENIPYEAFRDNKKLESIVLPSTLKSIDRGAFYHCVKLRCIVIPEGITELNGTFEGCKSLEEITLPQSLRKIGRRTFYGCTALKKIIIPDGVTVIESEAFRQCKALETIILPQYLRKLNDGVFTDCRQLHRIMIPEGIAEIWKNTFSGCIHLEEVVLPDSIHSIGPKAFADCEALTHISFPAGLKTIYSRAFLNCSALNVKALLIPSSTEVAADSFEGCLTDAALEPFLVTAGALVRYLGKASELELPEYIQEIGESAFEGVEELRSVLFNSTLRVIRPKAFLGCSNLQAVSIPGSVVEIGDHAFASCHHLRSVEIHSGLQKLGDSAFYGCSELERVILPETLLYYGASAFLGCNALTSVNISFPEDLSQCVLGGYTGRSCFQNAPKLLDSQGFLILDGVLFDASRKQNGPILKIPEGVKRVDFDVFCGDTSIEELLLPSTIKEIGDNAFRECCNLRYVKADGRIRKIGACAFWGCVALEKFEAQLLKPVPCRIGHYAFHNCISLDGEHGLRIIDHILVGISESREYESLVIPGCVKVIPEATALEKGPSRVEISSDTEQILSLWPEVHTIAAPVDSPAWKYAAEHKIKREIPVINREAMEYLRPKMELLRGGKKHLTGNVAIGDSSIIISNRIDYGPAISEFSAAVPAWQSQKEYVPLEPLARLLEELVGIDITAPGITANYSDILPAATDAVQKNFQTFTRICFLCRYLGIGQLIAKAMMELKTEYAVIARTDFVQINRSESWLLPEYSFGYHILIAKLENSRLELAVQQQFPLLSGDEEDDLDFVGIARTNSALQQSILFCGNYFNL